MDLVELKAGYHDKKYWEINFWISTSIEYFVYRYIIFFRDGKTRLNQRGLENVCVLAEANRFPSGEVNKEPDFRVVHNIYKRRDGYFNKDFEPTKLTDEIYIGPYPVLQTDFTALKELDIKSGICLLSEEEFKEKNIEMSFYRKLFARNN